MRHIAENQSVARLQRFFEGIVPDDIARQAGIAAQAVGVFICSGLSGAYYLRPVRHLQYIGHMAGCRCVEYADLHTVINDIQHARDKETRIERYRLSRLKIYLNAIFLLEVHYRAY